MSHPSTILIVDDEPAGRLVLDGVLGEQGYALVFAEDGATALRQAVAHLPDLILLDVMMPGMDGFEVCRRLRADPALAEVPILMVTALDDQPSRMRGLEAGADDFISKPFHRAELRARIKTIVRLNRYRSLITERERLQVANRALEAAYDATLEGWVRALDLRCEETTGHSRRVTELTVHLAQTMGIQGEVLVHIRRGALLHDIGKMGIPDSILLKPGPLAAEEWAIMRRHPQYAYDMLAPIEFLRPALDIPLCHHEKWDGTGYPAGLRGEAIPLAARMFASVDIWDALRSDRPYRQGWPRQQVWDHIRTLAGTHLDPRVVEAFLTHLLPTLP
jgi:putative two-component system response regulator